MYCPICGNKLVETSCVKTGEIIVSYEMGCRDCRLYCITYDEGETEIGIGDFDRKYYFTVRYPYDVADVEMKEVDKQIVEIMKLFKNKISQNIAEELV
jgi:hypothetical protein